MEGSNNINKKQMIDLKLIEPKLIARNRDQRGCQKLKTSYLLYGKIPLIRPARLYGQRTNLMSLHLGGEGGLYTGGDYIQGLALCRAGVLTGFYSTLF